MVSLKNYNQRLINDFDYTFNSCRNKPIALYGLGEKTEIILQLKDEYNIIGLMDSNNIGETIYGLKVLSNEEVAKEVEIIIIVANISSCPIIYQRIEFLKQNYGIEIFYLNGFIPQPDEKRDSDPYWEKKIEDIYKEIDVHDVICFDVFDTLIMRKVFLPTDIFGLVEERLCKQYGLNIEFKKNRIRAERDCYQKVDKYCDIDQIYDELKKMIAVSDSTLERIQKLEYQIEFENCIARDEVVKAYEYAINKNKIVYLITDMYWKKQFLKSILEKSAIFDYEKLLSSCEQKKSKHDGNIWEIVLKASISDKILHIGDNPHADIEIPGKYGISTYYVRSSFEIVQNTNLKYLYNSRDNKLASHLILGKFAASALNSPFALNENKGKLKINTMYEMGSLIFGPLVLNYILWLIKKCNELRIDQVLFFARDGYILKEVYDFIAEQKKLNLPKSRYFLTSRRAASVPTIKDENDIVFIIKKLCKIKKCKIGDIISRTFGIEMDKGDLLKEKYYFQITEDELIRHIVNKYTQKIIKNSNEELMNYEEYISNLDIDLEANLACVNFVGRGLTQKFVEIILKSSMNGFYFATEMDMMDFFDETNRNFGLYGEFVNSSISKSFLISNYLIGEIIFSSPDEQLIKFDEKGTPVFNKKSSKRDFSLIKQCHDGIIKYVADFINSDPYILERVFDTVLIDNIYGLLVADKCVFSNEIRMGLLFNDYYNSETENIYLNLN